MTDPEAALREWATRRRHNTTTRAALIADAWNAGVHNIALLAATAGVARGTVYTDLRAQGIQSLRDDMTDKDAPYIATLWALGVTALAAALLWTAATMPDRPGAARVTPISSITPTNPAAR